MLRRRHTNALTDSSKEKDLVELHYRLKRQREKRIMEREEKEASRRFKKLLARY